MKQDAMIARDIAKSQLDDQEKQVYAERRKRELELNRVRKQSDEKKLLQERYQHRIVSYCDIRRYYFCFKYLYFVIIYN